MHDLDIITTGDGSHSLRIRGVGEHYHSVNGAVAESLHVFINAGLMKVLESSPDEVHILEVGFGTGLNALLSLHAVRNTNIRFSYTALEPFPLDEKLWRALNYPRMVGDENAARWFSALHEGPWGEIYEPEPGFGMQKLMTGLMDYDPGPACFDLVYFDAFGPDVQPELWNESVFFKIAGLTSRNAIIVTYSAKGSVRRAMQAAGFAVERLPGPVGKREMLRGRRLEGS